VIGVGIYGVFDRRGLLLMCRFLGCPARRRRLGTGFQASEKRQGTKSRGVFQVYGDLTGAAMMAGLA